VRTYRLDTDRDNVREWVVLYRFDLSEEADQEGTPIGGVIYGQEDGNSSAFTSYALNPQGDAYLCECECGAEMEDVLSRLSGPELVLRDHCGGEVARASIFYWDQDQGAYLPKGYFFGSRIEVGQDHVTVDQRLPRRAQLALRQVYRADRGRTYYGPFGQGVLAMPEKYELVGYQPEPTDVTLSPYPEKVLLAFYNHYAEGERVAEYFTEKGWQELDRCADGKCGCSTPRSGVAHVRVTYLERADGAYGEGENPGPNEAAFDLNVICERRGDRPEEETPVRWYLVRQDGRWKLDDAEMVQVGEQDQEED
jgi:hypothetical protein